MFQTTQQHNSEQIQTVNTTSSPFLPRQRFLIWRTRGVLTHSLCISSDIPHQLRWVVVCTSPKPSAGPSRSDIPSSCLSGLTFLKSKNQRILDQSLVQMFVCSKGSSPRQLGLGVICTSRCLSAVTGRLPNLVLNLACSLTRVEGRTTNSAARALLFTPLWDSNLISLKQRWILP